MSSEVSPLRRLFSKIFMLLGLVAMLACTGANYLSAGVRETLKSSRPLPDLSGLAWMGDDLFIAVHDAKNSDELDRPRVSLMTPAKSLLGVLWSRQDPAFPNKKSSDLESAARIPGTAKVLLSESTDDGGPFNRIFLGELQHDAVKILGVTTWSAFTKSYNVEATAVATAGDGKLMFIWAERNSGKTHTDIKWTRLSLDPFQIGGGAISSVRFELPKSAYDENGKPLYDRSLVAMDIDSQGQIYVAASLDPEGFSLTPDDGPFRSVIYRIGSIEEGAVVLDPEPAVMGVLDGFKVESVAVREDKGKHEIFVGTDDENYGGIMRVMPTDSAR